MEYKKSMIIIILAIFLFSIASVCASDTNDTAIVSEDTTAIELSQSDEMTASDDSNAMEQSDDEELILEDNDIDKPILGEKASTGSFTDLDDLINNQYGSNDTITLSCNYTFNGTDDDDSGFIHGININREVTIDGKGCTIDGSQKARIFNIENGGTVKFLNINFINGKATGSGLEMHGGAISAPNSNCVVECCNFTNNTADNQGGALMRVTAYNCTFTGNTAYHGGAINEGIAYNCTFTGNKAIGGDGGAIDFGSAYNCVFTGNTADYGGAIYNGNAYNCTFTGNTAELEGGAIYYGSAYNCTFTGNTAIWFGGGAMRGVENHPEDYSATLCIFDSNTPNDYRYIRIVNVVLSADNLTTSYKSGDRLLFNLTADNTNYVGFNTTIKIYQDEQEIGTYYALSGEGWIVDLNPGTYKAVLSLDKYEGVTNGTATITITDGTTFWDLNQTINGNTNGTITLNNNYTYNSASDSAFTEGILINRQVTINGNGYTIDAQGKARVFNVQASDVTIENITFKNANFNSNGGAIYFSNSGSVTNCNFTNNSASDWGGAIYFSNSGSVTNCNFTNNSASNCGGAVYFLNTGTVSNCNFTNNSASNCGGAVYFLNTGTVSNCNFTNNTATNGDGGAIWMYSGSVENCNFIGNNATYHGGAVFFLDEGTVENCNFTNNKATGSNGWGGAILFASTGNVTNCNFTGNNAITGSAIYFYSNSATKTVSNSRFLNNRANAEDLQVTKNDNNITIVFTGKDNLLNAIYSSNDAEVTFTNVTYWSTNGIATTESSAIKPSRSNKEVGQNISVGVVVNGILVLNEVKITDENGMIVLDISAGDNYYITARHESDSYYTEAEKTNSTMKFNVNVTSQTTNNKTVNITAKSNIFREVMPGKLLFILPNGVEINATYASNGTWWAVHTFDDYNDYQVNASYIGLDNVTITNATISITKANSTVNVSDVVMDWGDSTNVTVTAEGETGITAMIDNNPVSVINNYTIMISGLDVGTYNLTVATIPDENHISVNKTVTITVNKAKTEITASAITTTYNINKDLVITLKDSNGNALSGAEITVDLNGAKTYTTDANGQVKVSTKGLAPKAYTAKITFNGNTNYAESTKDVKVTVKKATPKLTAKKKTFKSSVKTKKYTVTLKDNTGKAIKKAKVILKVKGKTYKATTNSKGKATFKIKKLNKKGTFKATVTYKGNKCYNKATKKAKIKVIVTFKTVSKGSKDKATVKEIQQALKNNGYYLSYKGHYLKVDGKFQSCTERSVKEFQHDKGLKVTGKVDEKTAKKLGLI